MVFMSFFVFIFLLRVQSLMWNKKSAFMSSRGKQNKRLTRGRFARDFRYDLHLPLFCDLLFKKKIKLDYFAFSGSPGIQVLSK